MQKKKKRKRGGGGGFVDRSSRYSPTPIDKMIHYAAVTGGKGKKGDGTRRGLLESKP